MFDRHITTIAIVLGVGAAACNPDRKLECERFLAAMTPLDDGAASAETVDRVRKDVEALKLADQPLRIYATNYQNTLTVLSATLALKADPSAPDGTDDVIKTRLREAHAERDDVRRYCAQ